MPVLPAAPTEGMMLRTWDSAPCKDHGRHGDKHRYASKYVGGGRASPRYVDQHVLALIEHTGQQPNGRCALHHCDNKRCIEGSHLYWGTKSDNAFDAVARGQHYTPFRRHT